MNEHPSRKDLEWLLQDLCVQLGFCLRLEDQARLTNEPPGDADAFTHAVFRAEGMDPGVHRELWNVVRARVGRTFLPRPDERGG